VLDVGVPALALGLAACAVVEAPPGGPTDVTRPHLAGILPDSGAVGLADVDRLYFTFSEKMNRTGAGSWLRTFPEQKVRKTSWHGARTAEVQFFDPLPSDTVIVVEVAGGMEDAHKVKNRVSRRWPIATADSIPDGTVSGSLVMGDSALTKGVVELLPAGPDSVPVVKRPVLRRTVTDGTGRYVFPWLPASGERWILRAFADDDGNLRIGEREAQRLLPDTLSLAPDRRQAEAGAATLYAPDTPGRFVCAPFTVPGWATPLRAWASAVAEQDTGFVPGAARPPRTWPLDPTGGSIIEDAPPGEVRVVVFVDVDRDSLLSRVRGEQLPVLPDSLPADGWYFEPWWLIEGLTVEPGLPAALIWHPDAPRFTATTAPDTAAARADSMRAAQIDSVLRAAQPEGTPAER